MTRVVRMGLAIASPQGPTGPHPCLNLANRALDHLLSTTKTPKANPDPQALIKMHCLVSSGLWRLATSKVGATFTTFTSLSKMPPHSPRIQVKHTI